MDNILVRVSRAVHEDEDLALSLRMIDSLIGGDADNKRFQISFEFGITVKLRREAVVDKLIAESSLLVHSKGPGDLVLVTRADNVISLVKVFQKPGYCSLYLKSWAEKRVDQKGFENLLKSIFKDDVTIGVVCGIQWAFQTSKGMQTVYIEETFDDVVHDEAYPAIIAQWGSIEKFITAYLESDEAILILQGPAGTGKSRLIRKILALLASSFDISQTSIVSEYRHFSLREDMAPYETGLAPSLALYTGDMKVLESDEIFARFLTSEERVFIVEDADNALKPRSHGNNDLHRFLTVSDGIIKSIGRKVIFTTNLPNIGDLDDALIRPGRCFAALNLNFISRVNAGILLKKFSLTDVQIENCLNKIFFDGKNKSLAEIYKYVKGIQSEIKEKSNQS